MLSQSYSKIGSSLTKQAEPQLAIGRSPQHGVVITGGFSDFFRHGSRSSSAFPAPIHL